MLSKMFLIPFLCVMSSGLLSAAIMPCGDDGECPPNHFCYTVTNYCAQCVPNYCSRLNRKDSAWRQCHTEPSDCGPCMPGFEEDYFSDGTTRSSCILTHRPTPSHYSGYQNSPEGPSPIYLFAVIGFSMVALLGFFVYKTVHRPTVHIIRSEERELRPINSPCNHERSNNSDVFEPSAPILPEYSRVDPFRTSGRAPCGNHGNSTAEGCCGNRVEVKQPLSCCEHSFEVKQPDTCRLLESAIFRRPNYEEDNVDNVANAQDNEDEEEDPDSQEVEEDTNRGSLLIPPVQYHEESTQPSSWTPEPLQAELENPSLPTNPETTKRPSTEMVSSESEDEQNPKRVCNNENEEDDEAPSTGIFHSFRSFFRRHNHNTNQPQTQNKNSESPKKDK